MILKHLASKLMLQNIFLCITLLLIFSCSSNEEAEKTRLKKELELHENSLVNRLTNEYRTSYDWDTLNYDFSIEYTPVLETSSQLIKDIDIIDIFRKDSSEYVLLKTGYYRGFYFEFPISLEQRNKLLEKNKLILVVGIEELRKLKFELTESYDETPFATINPDISLDFIGKGQIKKIVAVTN